MKQTGTDDRSNQNTLVDQKPINKEDYEEDLKKRQKVHLDSVPFKPCLHDGCLQCIGTGIKKDGSKCSHNIICLCPKCTLKY